MEKNNCPDHPEFLLSSESSPIFIELRNDVIKRIEHERICYIYVECTCSTFYLDDDSRFNSLKPLREIQKMLPPDFFRIHRNYIVNSMKISELRVKERNIILTNGKQLPVSFRNVKALSERLLSKY